MPTLRQIIKNKSSSNRLSKKKFVVAKALNKRPQLRGVCIKIYTTKPKKPNSANRKVAKLKLSTGKKIIAYVNGSGHNLQQHSVVMVRGGRRRDLPGIHYQLIRGKYDFTIQENFIRTNRRSKFSTKKIKKKYLKEKWQNIILDYLLKKVLKIKQKKSFILFCLKFQVKLRNLILQSLILFIIIVRLL